MVIEKLKRKADLWLTLHGIPNFRKEGHLRCTDICKYYKNCKQYESIVTGTNPVISIPREYVYKDACIKWLDDIGFTENEI
jgi:hypothetical protein